MQIPVKKTIEIDGLGRRLEGNLTVGKLFGPYRIEQGYGVLNTHSPANPPPKGEVIHTRNTTAAVRGIDC